MTENLRIRARALKSQLTVFYYASLDPRVPLGAKLIVALALGYALSPIDLIPDFVPVLGLLDDLLIVPALLGWALRLVPPEVLQEARSRAEAEPLSLGRNWGFGVFFLLVWALLLGWTGVAIYRIWGPISR